MAAVADTAGRGSARRAPVPDALVRASVVLLLILFVGSSALSVRAYVLSDSADFTTASVRGASNSLLIDLLNAETGQRGYLLTSNPVYLQPYDTALSTVPADQQGLEKPIREARGLKYHHDQHPTPRDFRSNH